MSKSLYSLIFTFIVLLLLSTTAYAGLERIGFEGALTYSNYGSIYKFGGQVGVKLAIPFPLAGEQALRARVTYFPADTNTIKQLLIMIDGVQSFRVNDYMRIYGGIGMNLSFPRDSNAATNLKTGFGGQLYGGGEFFLTDQLSMFFEGGGIMIQTVDNAGVINLGRTIKPWAALGGRLAIGGGKPKLIKKKPKPVLPYIKLDHNLKTTTTYHKVRIRGSIGSDVVKVLVDKRSALVKRSLGLFYIKMDVKPGDNKFIIEAYDEKDNINKIEHMVYGEVLPPKIILKPMPLVTKAGAVGVKGKAFSVKTLFINDTKVWVRPNGIFFHKVQLSPGKNTIVIRALRYDGGETVIKKSVIRK